MFSILGRRRVVRVLVAAGRERLVGVRGSAPHLLLVPQEARHRAHELAAQTGVARQAVGLGGVRRREAQRERSAGGRDLLGR